MDIPTKFYLSQVDLVAIYDKQELCDVSLISISQLVNEHVDPLSIGSNHVVHIVSENEELKLLSFLNTWSYIEFDDLCELNNLKEK